MQAFTCPGFARRGALLATLAAVAIPVIAAPAAQAKIVVGKSIDGISFGYTEGMVEHALGAPTYKTPEGENSSWGYPKTLEGRIGFDHIGQVTGMWTGSKHQKTNKGIGPGSSLARTRKAYPHAKCSAGPFGPKSAVCVIKSHFPGRTVETTFVFFTRKAPMREVNIDIAS